MPLQQRTLVGGYRSNDCEITRVEASWSEVSYGTSGRSSLVLVLAPNENGLDLTRNFHSNHSPLSAAFQKVTSTPEGAQEHGLRFLLFRRLRTQSRIPPE
jgi:hypothetical protein